MLIVNERMKFGYILIFIMGKKMEIVRNNFCGLELKKEFFGVLNSLYL